MSTPYILYNNLVASGSLSASSTATGYNVNNVIDNKTFTSWKANSSGAQVLQVDFTGGKVVDSWALVRHNLYDAAATIKLEGYVSGSWVTLTSDFTVTSNDVIFKTVDSSTVTKLKLTMTTASIAPQVALFFAGAKMTFPYPPDSPFAPIVQGVEVKAEVSKTGHLLGIDKRYNPFTIAARFSDVPATFATQLDAFYSACSVKPFIWSYLGNYFVRLSSNYQYQKPQSVTTYIESFTLDMEGAIK